MVILICECVHVVPLAVPIHTTAVQRSHQQHCATDSELVGIALPCLQTHTVHRDDGLFAAVTLKRYILLLKVFPDITIFIRFYHAKQTLASHRWAAPNAAKTAKYCTVRRPVRCLAAATADPLRTVPTDHVPSIAERSVRNRHRANTKTPVWMPTRPNLNWWPFRRAICPTVR